MFNLPPPKIGEFSGLGFRAYCASSAGWKESMLSCLLFSDENHAPQLCSSSVDEGKPTHTLHCCVLDCEIKLTPLFFRYRPLPL
jgi:hypothetical protein